jgi:acetamidase/formamidase
MRPFLGCGGVAPAAFESRSDVPAEFGGNMDAQEASVKYAIPPGQRRRRIAIHGRRARRTGDGEIAGTAYRSLAAGACSGGCHQKKTIHWPRFENSDYIMAVCSYCLDDATRIAFTELIHWIHESYGCLRSTPTNCFEDGRSAPGPDGRSELHRDRQDQQEIPADRGKVTAIPK